MKSEAARRAAAAIESALRMIAQHGAATTHDWNCGECAACVAKDALAQADAGTPPTISSDEEASP